MQKKILFFRHIFIFFLVIFFASCTVTKVAYNSSGLLVRLWINKHFDLKGEQSDEFKTRLARIQKWHRSQELPQYEKIIRQFEQRFSSNELTSEDVQSVIKAVRQRYKVLTKVLAEESTPILLTLSSQQLTHLQAQFDKDNEKFIEEEYMEESTEKQLEEKIKWTQEKFQDWIGDLSLKQEQMIETAIREMPMLLELRLADRKKYQHDFIALMKAHHNKHSMQPAFQDFLENIEDRRSPAYAQAIQKSESRFTQLLVQIHKTLSSKQHAYASNRFLKLAQDLHELNGAF